MKACIARLLTLALATAGVRGACQELLDISLPLTGDTVVYLTDSDVTCDLTASEELQEFTIRGGSLTLTGLTEARFANVIFNVTDGAGLIFDFDHTFFDPAVGYGDLNYYVNFMLNVEEGGYAEFSGEMSSSNVETYWSIFRNLGTLEFKSDAKFNNTETNVFRFNYGDLRFYGSVTIVDCRLLGIRNIGGTVRIDGDAHFETIGRGYEGAGGAAVANFDDGIMIFEGEATFLDVRSEEAGGALNNGGEMTFQKKVGFYDNVAYGNGGAFRNAGNLEFMGDVEVIGNRAGSEGGGLSVWRGYISFGGSTVIQDNNATDTGGAMALTDYGTNGSIVEFKDPSNVLISGNRKTGDEEGCNEIYVEENSQLIGYVSDGDICDES